MYLVLIAVVASFAAAGYTAGLAMTDKQATLATFYGFFVRLCAVALSAGYLILTEMRTLDSENIHLWLGLPIGRTRYLLEKSVAYVLIMAGVTLTAGLPLLWASPDTAAAVSWSLTLYCELLMVAAVALLLSMIFRQPLSALSAFAAVYLFARGAAEFYRHASNLISQPGSVLDTVIAWTVKLITYLVPRLENFAAAEWLQYPQEYGPQWGSIFVQTCLYSGLLFALALERIRRMEF